MTAEQTNQLEKLATALDLTMTRRELVNVAAFLDEETEADDDAVRLLVGDGHSGYGLYAASPDYQEEGAILVKSLPAPDEAQPVVAWLRSDGLKAMPADEKEAWIEVGQPEIAEDYTTPLYATPKTIPASDEGGVSPTMRDAQAIANAGGLTKFLADPANQPMPPATPSPSPSIPADVGRRAVEALTDAQIEKAALASGLDEELWFGPFTPKGYEDALPKLRRFASEIARASITELQEALEGKMK